MPSNARRAIRPASSEQLETPSVRFAPLVAVSGDDRVALLPECRGPFVRGRWRFGGARLTAAAFDTGDLEQIVQLLVGQLDEEVGKKSASRFADDRVVKSACVRLAEVTLADSGVL